MKNHLADFWVQRHDCIKFNFHAGLFLILQQDLLHDIIQDNKTRVLRHTQKLPVERRGGRGGDNTVNIKSSEQLDTHTPHITDTTSIINIDIHIVIHNNMHIVIHIIINFGELITEERMGGEGRIE